MYTLGLLMPYRVSGQTERSTKSERKSTVTLVRFTSLLFSRGQEMLSLFVANVSGGYKNYYRIMSMIL